MSDDRKPEAPDLRAIRAAAERIRPYAHQTPVLTCTSLNAMVGAELFFKCENLQKKYKQTKEQKGAATINRRVFSTKPQKYTLYVNTFGESSELPSC